MFRLHLFIYSKKLFPNRPLSSVIIIFVLAIAVFTKQIPTGLLEVQQIIVLQLTSTIGFTIISTTYPRCGEDSSSTYALR